MFSDVSITKKDSVEVLHLTFNEKKYEFKSPDYFVRNEKDPNIVALTYQAIIMLANAEGVQFETKDILKLAYNQCTVRVVATAPNGRMREAIIGKNKDNMPADAKGDVDSSAHKKACMEAFCALYDIPSTRFNISNGQSAPKKGVGGINMGAIDEDENVGSASDIPDVPAAPVVSSVPTEIPTTENAPAVSPHADTVMPFGPNKGKRIFDMLAETDGLGYFVRLFAVNQAIKNNNKVSDAVFAYYEGRDVSDAEKANLAKIRESLNK